MVLPPGAVHDHRDEPQAVAEVTLHAGARAGGATCGVPVEVDLASLPLTGGNPTIGAWLVATATGASGVGTATFEADLTVDAQGHPHLLMGVGHESMRHAGNIDARPGQLLVDLTSSDGGASWRGLRVADLNAHEFALGGASGSEPLVVGNDPQIARKEDGSRVFYSWTDTDPAICGDTGGRERRPGSVRRRPAEE